MTASARALDPDGWSFGLDDEPAGANFLADLHTAAALTREFDWRRLSMLFRDHAFAPLAHLAAAAGEALLAFPAFSVVPAHLIELGAPQHKRDVAALLGIFGVWP